MLKFLQMVFTILLLSFYFFPIVLSVLPINTKTTMAALGLVILAIQFAKRRNSMFSREVFFLSIYAMIVSLLCFFSVIYNGTSDFTYVTYFISMWVWLSAAYVVVSCMKKVHGYVSVLLLCNYLITLCAVQCVLALVMDFYKPLQDTVYSFMDEETVNFILKSKRLCGLGAGLDVAGSRFSVILVMIAIICTDNSLNKKISKYYPYYILAFIIIAVIGNMISRTTTIGLILATFCFIVRNKLLNVDFRSFYLWMLGISTVLILIIVYTYYTIPEMYKHIRFAFEGFFSLIEKGKWEVHSNEILQDMYVFPDNVKTWLIGDGYFNNPYFLDPYYIGKKWIGFYMDTDVGYLRFIYYFGIIGLIAFCTFMINVVKMCVRQLPEYRILFLLLLVINFFVWFKVSTDIFLVFALFLCITKDEVAEEFETYAVNVNSQS